MKICQFRAPRICMQNKSLFMGAGQVSYLVLGGGLGRASFAAQDLGTNVWGSWFRGLGFRL